MNAPGLAAYNATKIDAMVFEAAEGSGMDRKLLWDAL